MSDQTRNLPVNSSLPDPATLPSVMTDLPQWGNADRAKIPHNPITGRRADTTDLTTCGTFTAAIKRAMRDRRLPYVCFVFAKDGGLVGIDLDHCRDPETGEIEPWAWAIVRRLNSYTEISLSGTGLHIIVAGTLPPGGRKRGQVEMYGEGRHFVMTGNVLPDFETIAERTDELAALHRETFPPEPTPAAMPNPTPLTLDTEEILKRCQGSARFQRLYAGDMSDYPDDSKDGVDHSAADLALLNIVVRNSGTRAQADEIMRSSGLCRPKWDERRGARTYGEETLDKAFNGIVRPFMVKSQVGSFVPPPLAATGTEDALPDDIPTLKAMIVALTRRVEIAEQHTEQAEARAAAAERRAATLSQLQSKTTGILRNNKLRQERFTSVALAYQFGNREAAGDPGEDGLYPIPLARIAESAGVSPNTVSRHIATLEDAGVLRKQMRWIPERVDTETGEIIPGHKRQFIGPIGNVISFVDAVAQLEPKRLNKDGTEVGAWGGAKVCKDHPNAGTVKRWTLHCAECDRQLDAGEEEFDTGGTPLTEEPNTSVVSHYRRHNGAIDDNDLPAADGTVAGAWLRGASLPGMSPPRPDRYTDPPPGAAP